ncbi:hypothetical protein VZT92_009634 [Zoarces viviparus]|uniref:Uncharacterized protein n=1 Tax=Zoarces viviparus TaxID=48416 RepID=A0AAW1FBY5_ZOAVI
MLRFRRCGSSPLCLLVDGASSPQPALPRHGELSERAANTTIKHVFPHCYNTRHHSDSGRMYEAVCAHLNLQTLNLLSSPSGLDPSDPQSNRQASMLPSSLADLCEPLQCIECAGERTRFTSQKDTAKLSRPTDPLSAGFRGHRTSWSHRDQQPRHPPTPSLHSAPSSAVCCQSIRRQARPPRPSPPPF